MNISRRTYYVWRCCILSVAQTLTPQLWFQCFFFCTFKKLVFWTFMARCPHRVRDAPFKGSEIEETITIKLPLLASWALGLVYDSWACLLSYSKPIMLKLIPSYLSSDCRSHSFYNCICKCNIISCDDVRQVIMAFEVSFEDRGIPNGIVIGWIMQKKFKLIACTSDKMFECLVHLASGG